MAGLLDLYLNTTIDGVTDARQQATGQKEVNFTDGRPRGANPEPDQFQTEFKTRIPGTKFYPLSQDDDATEGRYLDRGLQYYGEVVANSKYANYKGNLVHKYNQRDMGSYYSEVCSDAIGIIRKATYNVIL